MYRITLIIFILWSSFCIGQVSDIARIEYTYFPQRDSDNSFKRFRALANYPIKLNDNGAYLVPGVEYRSVNFDYEDSTEFTTSDLEQFHSVETTLGYTFKLKNDWRFATRLGALIASNFENDKIESDDVLFSGSVYVIKDKTKEFKTKPWRLILGLNYSTTAGRPFPLPFVNYFRKFHTDWTFTLGVPKSNIKYFFNEKNNIQAFATLDGFFANLQNNKQIPMGLEDGLAENISMTIVLSGLGYEYYFTDHILFYAYSGFTLLNDIRLRNGDGNDILTINDSNSFYVRGGLKLKI